jgi:predicted nucleic acid-binding protein
MIILDTNVVSEGLRASPEPSVVEWLDAQDVETLFLTTISLAELRYGVAILAEGKRKNALSAALENRLIALFEGRLLAFDVDSSAAYARLRATAKSKGYAIGAADGYIAGIAAARGFTVATRDVAPFEMAGVTVINPWNP